MLFSLTCLQIVEIDLGITFAATEITPSPPILRKSKNVGSSPEKILKFCFDLPISINSLILSLSFTASLIPMIFS